jgi:Ca-activated chloride channel family protein
MTNVEVTINGVLTSRLAPRDAGDIFFGNSMVLTGRYAGPSAAVVNISGLVDDERVTQELRLDFPEIERKSGFVARIWATRRIGELLESIRLEGESDELKDEVVALAKEFGIVTPYTSYLVREDERGLAQAPPAVGHRLRSESIRFDAAMQESTGRDAVELSRRIAGLQQAKQATDLTGPPAVSIAGQTLIQMNDGAWSTQADTAHAEPLNVQFGSEAYFLLARLYPESAEFLRLGDKVTFMFRNQLVRVGSDGRTEATEADLRSWFDD